MNSSTKNISTYLLTTVWIFLFFNIKFTAIGTLSISIGLIVLVGLSGFSTNSSGFGQVLGLFFLATYFYLTHKKPNLTFLIVSTTLIVSAILSSRSSLVGIILWLGFCLIYFRKYFIYILLRIILALSLILLILINLLERKSSVFFSNWIFNFLIMDSIQARYQKTSICSIYPI